MVKEDLKSLFLALIPIVRLDDHGKHLLGTQVKRFQVRMGQLYLYTQDGFTIDFQTWLQQNATIECVKFAKQLQAKSNSQQVLRDIITNEYPQLHETDVI